MNRGPEVGGSGSTRRRAGSARRVQVHHEATRISNGYTCRTSYTRYSHTRTRIILLFADAGATTKIRLRLGTVTWVNMWKPKTMVGHGLRRVIFNNVCYYKLATYGGLGQI